jgi:hypothetical protein
MADSIGYERIVDPTDDNPGGTGPIQPGGGDPHGHLKGPRKHAVGFLTRPNSRSTVVFQKIEDLRFTIPRGAKADDARIVIYPGKGQKMRTLGQQIVTLERETGPVPHFKIDPSTVPNISPHLRPGNTLGLEIGAPISNIPIKVSSVFRGNAKTTAKRSRKKVVKKALAAKLSS